MLQFGGVGPNRKRPDAGDNVPAVTDQLDRLRRGCPSREGRSDLSPLCCLQAVDGTSKLERLFVGGAVDSQAPRSSREQRVKRVEARTITPHNAPRGIWRIT